MSNKPTYETWPIDTINTVAWNPRVALRPTDPEWKQIAKSLEHFGLVVPLVVNRRTNNLISGHQRLAVLKHEGHTSVPVTVVNLDDDGEMQLNIAMNSVHGRWDEELLAGVLDYLADAGVAHLTGFTGDELAMPGEPLKTGAIHRPTRRRSRPQRPADRRANRRHRTRPARHDRHRHPVV